MRRNPMGQPMILEELRKQLWANDFAVDPLKVKLAKRNLQTLNLPTEAPVPEVCYQVTTELPHELHPSKGGTLRERLETLMEGEVEDTKNRVNLLLAKPLPKFDLSQFQEKANWTFYPFGGEPVEVPWPSDSVIDFETMVKFGNWPVMGAALSPEGWYIWLHPSLVKKGLFYGMLVPTNPEGQVYLAHNAGFDRSQCAGSYLKGTQDVWLDTMTMHMGSFGLSSDQRKNWENGKEWAPWAQVASPKSLLEACKLHTPGAMQDGDKELRDIFVEATSISIIRGRLLELVEYCAGDVWATHGLARHLWPRFCFDHSSAITLAGMVEMSRSLLPVDPSWPNWINEVETTYEGIVANMTSLLKERALALAEGGHDPSCPWTGHWNWTPAASGKNKGQPEWLRTKVLAKGKKLGPRSRLSPALLRLTWQGQPIFHDKKYGWVYHGDLGTGEQLTINGKAAWRVPHKKGDDVNVGSPLAKGYIEHYENGLMSSVDEAAKVILDEAAAISYWTSVRERVMAQKAPLIDDHRWIVPMLENWGTTTRRAVEPLWLTVASAQPHKVGSELKGMVRPPEGYTYVSADFSAQEMVILAGLSDKSYGFHGATGIGFIVMSGAAENKTDTHSLLQGRLNKHIASMRGLDQDELVMAKLALSRKDVKSPNYAMAYGAAVRGLSGFIRQAKPMYTQVECDALAREALAYMKGQKVNGRYVGGLASDGFNDMEDVARSLVPRTPVLGSVISCGLRQDVVGKDYMPSRCNWRIQSCGRDLLDILVSVSSWLFRREKLDAQFLFSYHDEALFMCKEGYEKRVAQLISIAHVYAWALFYEAIGMPDLPANIAWFGSVNVDKCFRKEVNESQTTRSYGSNVPSGYELRASELFDSGVARGGVPQEPIR